MMGILILIIACVCSFVIGYLFDETKLIFKLSFNNLQKVFQMQAHCLRYFVNCFVGNADSSEILDENCHDKNIASFKKPNVSNPTDSERSEF